MAFDRLALYNAALLLSGEKFLATLSEDREPRRLLDAVWNTNGVQYCLEQAQWWFAMRTVMIDYDPAITPTFGYRKAFTKPTDYISTSAVCQDEYFNTPLTQHAFEIDHWYADITPIYVKYISNDANYGGNLSGWPATFADYVSAYFASRIISKLAGDRPAQLAALFGPPGQPDKGILNMTLREAKNKSAFTQPTQFMPPGRWVGSRRGGRGGDGGNRGNLTG